MYKLFKYKQTNKVSSRVGGLVLSWDESGNIAVYCCFVICFYYEERVQTQTKTANYQFIYLLTIFTPCLLACIHVFQNNAAF